MNYHKITIKSFDANSILAEINLHKNEHVILDALQSDCTIKDLDSLLPVLSDRFDNGVFFALINDTINIDELEDEINIAPTLQEAIDMIEMEIMMRDL